MEEVELPKLSLREIEKWVYANGDGIPDIRNDLSQHFQFNPRVTLLEEVCEFALPDPLGVNHDLINARVLILIFLPSSSLLSQRISENWLEAF